LLQSFKRICEKSTSPGAFVGCFMLRLRKNITTARLCYEALVELGNHVDGLIWVSAGG
jgi:hypothetical protein